MTNPTPPTRAQITQRFSNYWKWLKHEYSQLKWRSYERRCQRQFEQWRHKFLASDAQVLVGSHFHYHGGVRNHMLAIKKYSALRVALVPEEWELQKFGVNPFNENHDRFLATPPPKNAIAVHTHVLRPLIDWAKIYSQTGLRWVHTHHALYCPSNGKSDIESWQKDLNDSMLNGARECNLCLCVSRWESDLLRREYGIESTYIPNGVDVLTCDRADGERFISRFKITSPFLLWVGRMDPIKNPFEFIQLAENNPTRQFVMIGGIKSEDIKREFSTVPPKNLHLLPQLNHENTLDAMDACQALIVTSVREGLPTVVLEAMALEKQIIIPEENGCMDATDGDSCATIYRPWINGDLNEQLQRTLRLSKPNKIGRERVLGEFDWKVVGRKLDKIYQGL